MAQQMMDDAVEMMTAARLENVKGFNHTVTPGSVSTRWHRAHGAGPEDLGSQR